MNILLVVGIFFAGNEVHCERFVSHCTFWHRQCIFGEKTVLKTAKARLFISTWAQQATLPEMTRSQAKEEGDRRRTKKSNLTFCLEFSFYFFLEAN